MKVAVIGSGVSGLGCAWALTKAWNEDSSSQNSVTVFEKGSYVGGHTNTANISPEQFKAAYPSADVTAPIPVDTGFIVYNNGNYPNMIRFLEELGVKTTESDMSFSISTDGVEWGSDGATGLFAQKSNIFKPRFLRFVWDMLRFNSEAVEVLNNPKFEGMTLGQYYRLRNYSQGFMEWYLLPMTGAIWSTPQAEMEAFPIQSMITFFHNHKLLQIEDRWQWRTIVNGSIEYVKKVTQVIGADRILLNTAITSIRRKSGTDGKITLIDSSGKEHAGFDKVVFACHADTALAILGPEATAQEREALGSFQYKLNTALLHADENLMPKQRAAWTSWNVLSPFRSNVMELTYWMNRLQPWISQKTPVFVTLNVTEAHRPPASKIFYQCDYQHPVFTLKSVWAQGKVQYLQGENDTYYAGAHLGYGFHEDGFTHGLLVAKKICASSTL